MFYFTLYRLHVHGLFKAPLKPFKEALVVWNRVLVILAHICIRNICSCVVVLFSCTRLQVCGSDGHTYMHDCARRKTACKQQYDIKVARKGSCTTGKISIKKDVAFSLSRHGYDGYCFSSLTVANSVFFYLWTGKSMDCWNTVFGCCPDNVTSASGVAYSGCPGMFCPILISL